MNTQQRRALTTVAALAALLAISACDRPRQSAANTPPPSAAAQAPQSSGPSESSAVPLAREGAKEGDGADHGKSPAMEPMTQQEESTKMPQPAQANDHSTLAKDSKR